MQLSGALAAPVAAGTQAGTVTLKSGDTVLAEYPVTVAQDVPKMDFFLGHAADAAGGGRHLAHSGRGRGPAPAACARLQGAGLRAFCRRPAGAVFCRRGHAHILHRASFAYKEYLHFVPVCHNRTKKIGPAR